MRRSSDFIFHDAQEFEVLGLLDVLARGRSYREPELTSPEAVALFAELGKDYSGTRTPELSQPSHNTRDSRSYVVAGDKLFKFPFEVPDGPGVTIINEPDRYDPKRLGTDFIPCTLCVQTRWR
jgi:hypothetical protein